MVEEKDSTRAHEGQNHGQHGQHSHAHDDLDGTGGGLPPTPRKTDTGGSKKKGPEGGFDETPIPRAPPGWTVKFTFHGASNLPLADINTLSADPFIIAQLTTALPTRHKEDPPLRMRTPTVRQNTNPQWNCEWIVANVPSSGFRLKCRIYDEDPADHDDRLGNVHVDVPSLGDGWPGIRDHTYPIRKRMVSKRAWLLRAFAVCFGKAKHMTGTLNVSVEILGRTADDHGGRVYTVGPQFWIRHYSPLLMRVYAPTRIYVARTEGLSSKESHENDAGVSEDMEDLTTKCPQVESIHGGKRAGALVWLIGRLERVLRRVTS